MKKHKQNTTCESSHGGVATLSRIFCGLIFIIAAIVVLLGSFGIINIGVNVGIFVAITALAIVAVWSLFHLIWGGFFFVVATIIVIMNANNLIFALEGQAIGGLYIAAALLTIAFHMIFFTARKKLHKSTDRTDANFSSTIKKFEGELDSANLECNFGNIKAYFEHATPKDGKATVAIECNFGGVELFIPKTWRVLDKTTSSFATTQEKNHSAPTDNSPTLTLTGEANFGGIVITYV